MSSRRLDLVLVERNLVTSRSKAQELIKAKAISVNGRIVSSSSHKTNPEDRVEVVDSAMVEFVSRAGLKMQGAFHYIQSKFSQDIFKERHVLDIGQSTGGFTECALKFGAGRVVGVDVGHDQLHSSLQEHPLVEAFSGINARELFALAQKDIRLSEALAIKFDIVVIDVSFVSATQMFSTAKQCVKDCGHVLSLVKPQFELGKPALNKKGVVTDESLLAGLEQQICGKLSNHNFEVLDYFPTEVPGKEGNQEYFVFAKSI